MSEHDIKLMRQCANALLFWAKSGEATFWPEERAVDRYRAHKLLHLASRLERERDEACTS